MVLDKIEVKTTKDLTDLKNFLIVAFGTNKKNLLDVVIRLDVSTTIKGMLTSELNLYNY